MREELPLVVPDDLFHRQPAHALDEAAFDLPAVDRRVERAADVVQEIGAQEPRFSGERVDRHLRHRGAVGEVVERLALEGSAVEVDLGRAEIAGRRERYARLIGLAHELPELKALRVADAHFVRGEEHLLGLLVREIGCRPGPADSPQRLVWPEGDKRPDPAGERDDLHPGVGREPDRLPAGRPREPLPGRRGEQPLPPAATRPLHDVDALAVDVGEAAAIGRPRAPSKGTAAIVDDDLVRAAARPDELDGQRPCGDDRDPPPVRRPGRPARHLVGDDPLATASPDDEHVAVAVAVRAEKRDRAAVGREGRLAVANPVRHLPRRPTGGRDRPDRPVLCEGEPTRVARPRGAIKYGLAGLGEQPRVAAVAPHQPQLVAPERGDEAAVRGRQRRQPVAGPEGQLREPSARRLDGVQLRDRRARAREHDAARLRGRGRARAQDDRRSQRSPHQSGSSSKGTKRIRPGQGSSPG